MRREACSEMRKTRRVQDVEEGWLAARGSLQGRGTTGNGPTLGARWNHAERHVPSAASGFIGPCLGSTLCLGAGQCHDRGRGRGRSLASATATALRTGTATGCCPISIAATSAPADCGQTRGAASSKMQLPLCSGYGTWKGAARGVVGDGYGGVPRFLVRMTCDRQSDAHRWPADDKYGTKYYLWRPIYASARQ